MLADKYLRNAVILSLALHSILILGLPHFKFIPSRRSLTDLEITYFLIKESSKLKQQARRLSAAAPRKHEASKLYAEKSKKRQARHKQDPSEKELKVPKKEVSTRKVLPKVKEVKLERPISPETDPAYLDYYQAVRERIRESAALNYKLFADEGEVYISFVLARSGRLRSLHLVPARSCRSRYLKRVAKQSIREASPYPPFPAELKQPEISFNVIISFRNSAAEL